MKAMKNLNDTNGNRVSELAAHSVVGTLSKTGKAVPLRAWTGPEGS